MNLFIVCIVDIYSSILIFTRTDIYAKPSKRPSSTTHHQHSAKSTVSPTSKPGRPTSQLSTKFVRRRQATKPLTTSKLPSRTLQTPPKHSCGVPKIPNTRIVGGTNATKGSWPWQVGLVYKGTNVYT